MTPDGSDNINNVSAVTAHKLRNVQQILSSSGRLLRPDAGPDVLNAIAETLRSAAETLQALADFPNEHR